MRTATLRWLRLDARDLPTDRRPVDEVMAREIDGMSIRNVFTPDEVARALERLDAMKPQATPQTFGAMLGMPLNQPGANTTDLTPHLDDADVCRDLYTEAFGFDPHERVARVFAALTELGLARAPSVYGRLCNQANIRWYEADRGGLRTHAGNEFIDLLREGAMHELLATTKVVDHMSYFVVLQRPDIGGQLSVFDVTWEQFRPEGNLWDEALRDDLDIEKYGCLVLDPEPGEMIVFGGGWRWHRVDPVEGSRPRITYGGFAGPALAGDAVHLWG